MSDLHEYYKCIEYRVKEQYDYYEEELKYPLFDFIDFIYFDNEKFINILLKYTNYDYREKYNKFTQLLYNEKNDKKQTVTIKYQRVEEFYNLMLEIYSFYKVKYPDNRKVMLVNKICVEYLQELKFREKRKTTKMIINLLIRIDALIFTIIEEDEKLLLEKIFVENKECHLCLLDFEEGETIKMECGHLVHKDCFTSPFKCGIDGKINRPHSH